MRVADFVVSGGLGGDATQNQDDTQSMQDLAANRNEQWTLLARGRALNVTLVDFPLDYAAQSVQLDIARLFRDRLFVIVGNITAAIRRMRRAER